MPPILLGKTISGPGLNTISHSYGYLVVSNVSDPNNGSQFSFEIGPAKMITRKYTPDTTPNATLSNGASWNSGLLMESSVFAYP